MTTPPRRGAASARVTPTARGAASPDDGGAGAKLLSDLSQVIAMRSAVEAGRGGTRDAGFSAARRVLANARTPPRKPGSGGYMV